MHITLHLTTECNMNCTYCYNQNHAAPKMDMNLETALQAVEISKNYNPYNTGIIFFGGEPLLKKDLIIPVIEKCREFENTHNYNYHYKITTNGLLLDESFLNLAREYKIAIGLSIDGIKEAHNQHRKTSNNQPTFEIIEPKIELLLKYQPYAKALITITPETVEYYAESINFLFNKGFRYIMASLNYAGNWHKENLKELKKQYKLLADLYEEMITDGKKFYFSPFETKLATHIRGKEALCYQCQFGLRQISVAPNGDVYPCVQFVQDGISNKEYCMGNLFTGIDAEYQNRLFEMSITDDQSCAECAIKDRCNHRCSCLNFQTTGIINKISPVLCETERIITPIVDKLGEKLYKKKVPMFIQKHYNAIYPLLSFLQDC